MGVDVNYLRVSKHELEEYLDDSSKLEARVFEGGENDYSKRNRINSDKFWESVFFLLTGASIKTSGKAKKPLRWTLNPPQFIDKHQEIGYGRAKYTTSNQTKEISIALDQISIDDLRSRYDSRRMMELEIYPDIWDDNESLEESIIYFKAIKEFYKAAQENQAVIILFL